MPQPGSQGTSHGRIENGVPASVQELILQAELNSQSVEEALVHYEAALEQLNQHIRSLPAGSTAQKQQIECFKHLLTTAECLKQQQSSNPPGAEYTWRQSQARHLAQQAVAADTQGLFEEAQRLYFRLLECLTKCHALETVPASKAAIMARFKVYLERAEKLRRCLLQKHGPQDA